jgi:hypothetical protein
MRLKVKYRNSAYKPGSYAYSAPYNYYEGRVVLPKPKGLSEYEFMLTTGDAVAPARILDKRDILEAWTGNDKYDDGVTLVNGDKKIYVVTRGNFGRYSCTCTAYHYRKWCSHINEVKKNVRVSSKRSNTSVG